MDNEYLPECMLPDGAEPCLGYRCLDRVAKNLRADMRDASKVIDSQQARIAELEKLTFRAYCEGYELGHHDTVEGAYTPPREYPEEWPEKLAALREGDDHGLA